MEAYRGRNLRVNGAGTLWEVGEERARSETLQVEGTGGKRKNFETAPKRGGTKEVMGPGMKRFKKWEVQTPLSPSKYDSIT